MEVEELQPNIRIEVPEKNQDIETQSAATGNPVIFNYKLSSRSKFLDGNSDKNRKIRANNVNSPTLLIPETQLSSEEQFRATFMSNFTRRTHITAQTEGENNNFLSNLQNNSEENKSNGAPQNEEDDQVVAKYKIIRDGETIGDSRLMEQESKSIKNLQNLIFFFLLIIIL